MDDVLFIGKSDIDGKDWGGIFALAFIAQAVYTIGL
jgi:hypothetical protein